MLNRPSFILNKIALLWQHLILGLNITLIRYPLVLLLSCFLYIVFCRYFMVVCAEGKIPLISDLAWLLLSSDLENPKSNEDHPVKIPGISKAAELLVYWGPEVNGNDTTPNTQTLPDLKISFGQTTANPDLIFLQQLDCATTNQEKASLINVSFYDNVIDSMPSSCTLQQLKDTIKSVMLNHPSYSLWIDKSINDPELQIDLAQTMFNINKNILKSTPLDPHEKTIIRHITTHIYFVITEHLNGGDINVLLESPQYAKVLVDLVK